MIGKRIKELREVLKITQLSMCERLEIKQSTLSRIEKEETEPNMLFLHNLSRIYNISMDWLINGLGSMQLNTPPAPKKTKLEKQLIPMQDFEPIKAKDKNISERLYLVRTTLSITQQEVVSTLKMAFRYYTLIENGEHEPSIEFIKKFAGIYNVNLNWLLFGEGDMFIDNHIPETDKIKESNPDYSSWRVKKNDEFMETFNTLKQQIKEPIHIQEDKCIDNGLTFDLQIVGDISAGLPLATNDIGIKHITVSRQFLSNPADYWCFRVNGESMSPEIYHNDYVILEKEYDYNDLDGRIVAVRNDEGVTLKRLLIDNKNQLSVLFPVNQKFTPIILDESHLIIGVLKLVVRLY